ncbi:MAG: hypothetical protein ABIQ31_17870 [Ferruginibacter sp.]
MFDNKKSSTYITGILEMPDGDLWFTCWGIGVKMMDKNFEKKENAIYTRPPPARWPAAVKNNIRNTWCMSWETATGNVWEQ